MRTLLTALCCLALSCTSVKAQFQKLVVNEFSQGSSGSKEYVELLVVGTRTCTASTADLRNWIFDDNNGWFGGSSTGIATGHYRFKNVANWSAIPFGSLILLYNDADKDPAITLPDDPTDANKDGVYVLPINSGAYIEENATVPSSPSSPTFTYPTTGYAASGSNWVAIMGLANGGDAVIITDPANLSAPHFSVTYGLTPGGSYKTPNVQLGAVGSASNAYLKDDRYTDVNSWVVGTAPANETPGAPNTPENASWISAMRAPSTLPSITLGTNPVICQGGTSADLPYTATTGGANQYTITWDAAAKAAGLTDISTATALPASPVTIIVPASIASGTYNGTIIPRNGSCIGSGVNFTLTVNAKPTVAATTGNNTVCAGISITLVNTTPGGTWSSSNTAVATVSSTGVVTGVAAGSSIISYTVGSGACSNKADFTIAVINAASAGVITGTSLLCVGATATFTNTVTGGTWSSSNGAVATINPTTGLLTAIGEGTADIRYTVAGGCGTNFSSYTLTVRAVPSITLTAGAPICISSTSFPLSFTATSGSPTQYSVTWDATALAAGLTNVSAQPFPATSPIVLTIPAASPAGTYSGTITVSNGGCSSSAQVFMLTKNGSPIVPASTGANTVCVGSTTTLSNIMPGGTWSSFDPSIATVNPSTGVVTGVSAGAATIRYTVGNSCGSSKSDFSLTVKAVPSLAVGASPVVCPGATTATLPYTAQGTTDRYSITWDAAAVAAGLTNVNATAMPASSPFSLSIPSTLAAGVYRGTIQPANATCSGAAIAFTLTVGALSPLSPTTGAGSLCAGTTTVLSNTTPEGIWSSGNATVASVNASGLVTALNAGTAIIRYTVTNSCGTNAADFSITVNALPVVPAITGAKNLCVGGTSPLSNTVNGGSWSSSNPAIASVNAASGLVTGVAPGTATITYTVTANGCTASQTFDIMVEQLAVTLTATPGSVNKGSVVQFTTNASIPYTIQSWTPSSLFPDQTALKQSVTLDVPTKVQVTARSAGGCIATGEVVVDIKAPDDLFIPNAFTPNGDGNNDLFLVYGSNIRSLELKIFNQWGELIFENRDLAKGWNGTVKGKAQPVGVYVYAAVITLADGTTLTKKGSVNLIR